MAVPSVHRLDQLAAVIRRSCDQVDEAAVLTLIKARDAGSFLSEAKLQCKKVGEKWIEWCEREFPNRSIRQFQKYMCLHERWEEIDRQIKSGVEIRSINDALEVTASKKEPEPPEEPEPNAPSGAHSEEAEDEPLIKKVDGEIVDEQESFVVTEDSTAPASLLDELWEEWTSDERKEALAWLDAKSPRKIVIRESRPASVEDVSEYCSERKNAVDAQKFWDYYEAQGWKLSNGRAMKSWRAAVRRWEHNGAAAGSEHAAVERDKQEFLDKRKQRLAEMGHASR